jgi:hypothetical protein
MGLTGRRRAIINRSLQRIHSLSHDDFEAAALAPVREYHSAPLWMSMNMEVSAGGKLSIALINASTGAAVPGFGYDDCLPFSGNRLAAVLRYRRRNSPLTNTTADLQPLATEVLQLGFRLRPPARVFAWRFHCG